MLNVTLPEREHDAVALPIPAEASEQMRAQAELIRTIWADQDYDGDVTSRKHRAAIAQAIAIPCRSIADVTAKLCLAMHELSPCTTKGDHALAFDPGDLPSEGAPAILAAVLNDLYALIRPAGDAAIVEAWDRWRAAHAALGALPEGKPDEYIDGYTPAERAQYEIMDVQEAVIRETVATTLRGVEVKLWLGMATRYLTWENSTRHARNERVDLLSTSDAECGSADEVVSALASLRAMQGRA